MNASSYARLAGAVFAVIALLQLARALAGWPVITVGGATMPVWPSWIAFVVAGALAWLGLTASRA
jgi:NAD/NADP transhydrogenase beta subunit